MRIKLVLKMINKQNIFIKKMMDKINDLKERKATIKIKKKESKRNKKMEVIKIKEKKRTINKNENLNNSLSSLKF